jgi:hypothetical protein
MKYASVLLAVGCLLSAVPAADSLNVRLIGYCYVVDWDSGLRIISITDPAHPAEVGYFDMSGGAISVAADGEHAYVGDDLDGLRVFSLADPTHPDEVGRCTTECACEVAETNDYVYATDGGGYVSVISVADPSVPVEVRGCRVADWLTDITAGGDYVLAVDQGYGLFVISVADPANPVEVGSLPGHFHGVALEGCHAYVTDHDSGLRVVSIADPTCPVQIGRCPLSDRWPGGVAVRGNHVYVADEFAGLRVISVADPARPTEVGYYDTPSCALDVVTYGDYVYVADYESGLQIYQFYGDRIDMPTEVAMPTVVRSEVWRSVMKGASVFDATGRRALNPKPGVYFVRDGGQGTSDVGRIRKVVITR